MDNRTNVILMSVLAAGIVALGGTILTGEYFHAERPEKMGYKVEGVEEEGGDAKAAAVPIAALLPKADLDAGATAFKACVSCHTINQGGANGIGPNLYGVMGQPIGAHVAGFAYSEPLKTHGGTWTFEAINEWLTRPSAFAKGTKMTFAGISDAQKRADLIAYINKQGSNLPYPPPPAEAAPTAEGAAPAADGAAAKPGGAAAAADPKGEGKPVEGSKLDPAGATPTAPNPAGNTAVGK